MQNQRIKISMGDYNRVHLHSTLQFTKHFCLCNLQQTFWNKKHNNSLSDLHLINLSTESPLKTVPSKDILERNFFSIYM